MYKHVVIAFCSVVWTSLLELGHCLHSGSNVAGQNWFL